jgi:predicted O-methyltransferase YrrM
MTPDEVYARIGDIPYPRLRQGRRLYDFITANHMSVGLELGFMHGGNTTYLAGAIQELGCGRLTAIDLAASRERVPNIDHLLGATGLSEWVQVYYEPTSYNSRLMRLLEEGRYETFDFCYISAGRTWYEVALAFCLVEKLLKSGGWVVFNDLHYNFRQCKSRAESAVKQLPEYEQSVPHVERVFELLAEANPYFGCYRRLGRLGFAQKQRAIWSEEQRVHHDKEMALCRAVERAHFDPEFRQALLVSPFETLSSIREDTALEFRNVRFVDTDYNCPISPTITESGEKTFYLQRAAWVRRPSEADLQKMLDE